MKELRNNRSTGCRALREEVGAEFARHIRNKKCLSDFQAAQHMRRGMAGAFVDAVILQPKLGGVGFDLKKFFSSLKGK